VSDWSTRRRVNLTELQRDLAQVAPVESDDVDALAEAVLSLLKSSQDDGDRRVDKTAIWNRLAAEMQLEADGDVG
jgi:flagellar motor switch protein FliG